MATSITKQGAFNILFANDWNILDGLFLDYY